MKTIHIAEMIAEGGRHGTVEAADSDFRVELAQDEDSGGVTPEHLFAGAYGSCYLGALMAAAEKAHIKLPGVTLTARAHLDEDDRGGYNLSVELRAAMPGVSESDAQHLMNLAHQTCPYSKATRGNINVTLELD
jgi:lipoyl-dependent peroxiredoxin